MQPFGQVPAYEEDDLVLFESGAILLHIADRSEVLMPSDSKARARVTAWMLAALNSIEPHIQNLTAIDLFHAEEDWAKKRRPAAVKFAQRVWPRSPIGSTVATIWRIVSPWRTF
jgi:glutathione S-transferase